MTSVAFRLSVIVCSLTLAAVPVHAQNRGLYPLGMSAVNSGVTPEADLTYANQLLFYSRDHARDAEGNTLVTGANAVIMDMNTLTWVTDKSVFGGRYSASATIFRKVPCQ